MSTIEELTAQVGELTRERDEWKGHARKHEDRAKDAAAKLVDAEKLVSDLTAQVAEVPDVDSKVDEAVATAKAEAADVLRAALIKAHGLDESAAGLLTATDAAALAEQASAVAALRGTAPSMPLAGYTPDSSGDDGMAALARDLFGGNN